MIWIVALVSVAVITIVLALVYIFVLHARIKRLRELHKVDLHYWIGERDRWRNLAERIANDKTIAEHTRWRWN